MIDQEINDSAIQYALGILPRKQVPDFESQLRTDPALQDLVSEYQQINEWDARESAVVQPPVDGYSRILERLASGAVNPVPTRSKVVPFLGWAGWGLAASFAAAFFIARSPVSTGSPVAAVPAAGSSSIIVSELTTARPQLTAAEATAPALRPAAGGVELRVLELANLAEAFWSSRLGEDSGGGARSMLADARLRSSQVGESRSEGFTVFDRELRIGVIALDDLPEMKPNRSSHIWANGGHGEAPVWAGIIPVGESNGGMFFFDLTDSAADLIQSQNLSFFITEESSSLPQKPTGRVVLTGL
jgi:anti-sigma-K factor RskA